MHFITNRHGHYFVVNTRLDLSLLKDCIAHDSLIDMYLHVCENQSLEVDEVEGHEYAITMQDGLWASVDDRGFVEMISGCVYEYINDFQL